MEYGNIKKSSECDKEGKKSKYQAFISSRAQKSLVKEDTENKTCREGLVN